MHLGRDRVICAYEARGLIVDPGPASCRGDAARRPGGRAARPAADPHPPRPRGRRRRRSPAASRRSPSTCTSAARRTWRTRRAWWPAPAGSTAIGWRSCGARSRRSTPSASTRSPAGRASRASEWRTRPATRRTTSATCDEDTGDAYVGDMAGVRLPPHEYTVAPTPPPDIDVEVWLGSIDLIARGSPRRCASRTSGASRTWPSSSSALRESLSARSRRARDARPRTSPPGRRPRRARRGRRAPPKR